MARDEQEHKTGEEGHENETAPAPRFFLSLIHSEQTVTQFPPECSFLFKENQSSLY